VINIYVGNLPYATGESELAALFEPFGEVVKASIIMDRETGRSRGFGFVEMTDADAGRKAIEALLAEPYQGRNLTINEARPRDQRRAPAYNRPTGGGYASHADAGPATGSVGYSRSDRPQRPSGGYGNAGVSDADDSASAGYTGGYTNTRIRD
jgi:cold-inducible RNA-binding protein